MVAQAPKKILLPLDFFLFSYFILTFLSLLAQRRLELCLEIGDSQCMQLIVSCYYLNLCDENLFSSMSQKPS